MAVPKSPLNPSVWRGGVRGALAAPVILVLWLQGNKPWISLPRGKGIRLTIAEERDKRLAAKQSSG